MNNSIDQIDKGKENLVQASDAITELEKILNTSMTTMNWTIENLIENEEKLSYYFNSETKLLTTWEECDNIKIVISKLIEIILSQKESNQDTIWKLKDEKEKAIELNKDLIIKNEFLQKDKLTWLPNRYKFETDFEKLQKEFEKNWKIFSFSILDIDNFKGINDTYWHLMWDKVLEFFPNFLIKNLNDEWENIYRFWWEEFVILMEENKIDMTKKLSEILLKLHKTVITSKIKKDLKIKFTFSGWVSQYWKNETFDSIFDKADDLLYVEKKIWEK